MSFPPPIFQAFNLPNATTWFYFSICLTVALFFKFHRLMTVRNWDVLTLFALVPGLLLLQEARDYLIISHSYPEGSADRARAHDGWLARKLAGYAWLLAGSAYFLARCLFDLALVRRPGLNPNLNSAGLTFFGVALFLGLTAVAFKLPVSPSERVGNAPVAQKQFMDRVTLVVTPPDAPPGGATHARLEQALAVACHLAIVSALVLIGWRHFGSLTSGLAASTFYLLLPYTAMQFGQVHHVWPTVLLLWAVFAYRRPTAAGLLLGLAAGSAFFPVLTVPAWLSFYRGRGRGRFLLMFLLAAGLSLALTGAVLWYDGEFAHQLQLSLSLSDWHPWRIPAAEGIWSDVHPAYRLPVLILYAAFVTLTGFWPAPKNLAHLIALCAATLVGIQFWYADRGGAYVLWYLPLLVLLVFRPNLSDRTAPVIAPDTDWVARLRARLAGGAARKADAPAERLAAAGPVARGGRRSA